MFTPGTIVVILQQTVCNRNLNTTQTPTTVNNPKAEDNNIMNVWYMVKSIIHTRV